MWDGKIYSAEEILSRYGRAIEEYARKETTETEKRHQRAIEDICSAVGVSYNFSHSSEGFEDWLERMSEEGRIKKSVIKALQEHWEASNSADDEFKALYYGLRAK